MLDTMAVQPWSSFSSKKELILRLVRLADGEAYKRSSELASTNIIL